MTYLELRTRTQYLRGEEDTAGETVINSHIQYAILDILNRYPFSWANAEDTISDGDTLPTDINRKWGVVVKNSDGVEFTEILPSDQDSNSSDYVFWLSGGKFYTHSSDTLKIFYNYIPTALSGDSDVCIIPDGEAVAYLAASKMYIGDERNKELKDDYKKESNDRVMLMIQADSIYGPLVTERSVLDYNSQITGG